MRKSSIFILILFFFAISGCKKSGNPVITPTNPSVTNTIPSSVDVYVCGISNTQAVYWKNKAATLLNGTGGSIATKILVNGSDVYISGTTNTYSNTNAVYWKNGTLVNLGPGRALSMAVSGTDVYVVGIFNDDVYGPVAAVWKNGAVTTLGKGQISAIQVVGTDVYLAGFLNANSGTTTTYWKNNVPVTLDNDGQATAIAVVGTDIYVAGTPYDEAFYWKNGTKTLIGVDVNPTDIAVSGTDVYVSGTLITVEGRKGGYWKNGVQNLFSGSISSMGGMVVLDGNVYISGKSPISISRDQAVLFFNGIAIPLSSGTATDVATSVAVVAH